MAEPLHVAVDPVRQRSPFGDQLGALKGQHPQLLDLRGGDPAFPPQAGEALQRELPGIEHIGLASGRQCV
jgi:hypothetical protein